MNAVHFKSVELVDFDKVLGTTSTEVSSVALGGRILACSDEWFAPASDLLKVGPAPSLKGQFGPKGALFDGWETRRHNPTYDWVTLRLGPAAGSNIIGFDVDTANFNGNEAPEVEIFGLRLTPAEEKAGAAPGHDDARWTQLIGRVPCNPSSRHLYATANGETTPIYTHVKLHMIPDGGIARFRVYGTVPPPPVGLGVNEHPSATEQGGTDENLNVLDLAHVLNGGRVVFTSDQHFGIGPNVLLPGRGKDMGDGWETKRSRAPGHRDWLIIKLGEPGYLSYAEIDTIHFLGNFPESVELHATSFDGQLPPEDSSVEWTSILPRTKTGPGKQHFFGLSQVEGRAYTHVKVTMHPDGGIKRVRLVGRRAGPLANRAAKDMPAVPVPGSLDKDLPTHPNNPLNAITSAATAAGATLAGFISGSSAGSNVGHTMKEATKTPAGVALLKAKPLTPEAYATFGDVVGSPQASGLEQAAQSSYKTVNQGTAAKYASQSLVNSTYPTSAEAQTWLHTYRCKAVEQLPFPVKVLERHRFTSQTFLPLGAASGDKPTAAYLVIVAANGPDDRPDLSTLSCFSANASQGITYRAGTWHHPMVALGSGQTDFAVVVNESDKEPALNCDEVYYDDAVAAVSL